MKKQKQDFFCGFKMDIYKRYPLSSINSLFILLRKADYRITRSNKHTQTPVLTNPHRGECFDRRIIYNICRNAKYFPTQTIVRLSSSTEDTVVVTKVVLRTFSTDNRTKTRTRVGIVECLCRTILYTEPAPPRIGLTRK